MTSWVVSDSSVLIATVLPQHYTPQALELWHTWDQEAKQIAAPILFRYEVIAVVRKQVHFKQISIAEGETALAVLLNKSVHYMLSTTLLLRAYELATILQRPTAYDSQYLAVAEALGCDFWTLDKKLYNAVQDQLPWVKWVGNLPL